MKKKKILKYVAISFFFILVISIIFSGTIMSQVDEPKYAVIETEDIFQVRLYEPVLVAQVVVEGERREAINAGFRLLADYIFGNNQGGQNISMTAPVQQQSNEKIAMTAPVIQQPTSKAGSWVVRFVMPDSYTAETLPKPNNAQVEIIEVPAKTYAVVKFSGTADEAKLKQNEQALVDFMKKKNYQMIGIPLYAFYNPPWTLPFMRRNEIMIEMEK